MFKVLLVMILTWVCCVALPRQAAAGMFEFSLALAYNRSTYSEDNYEWNRRWGSSAGYQFSDKSGIEFAMQDVVNRIRIVGYEDTTTHDQIYSFNWIQNFLGKNAGFQPYVKVGVGQLNREATGTYAGGASPPLIVDSVTGVLGAGFRVYLVRNLALRTEATTYLSGGSIRTWKDNVGITIGASLYF